MSAPRTKSNPPEYFCKIWLIWSEFPHSSFLATILHIGGERGKKKKKILGKPIIHLSF